MVALGLFSAAGAAHIIFLSESKGQPLKNNIAELETGEEREVLVAVDEQEAHSKGYAPADD